MCDIANIMMTELWSLVLLVFSTRWIDSSKWWCMFSLISSNGLISIYAKGAFYSKKVILIRKIVTYLYVLLFTVPCESGNYWKCDVSSCVACPQGFYQPQWGQTSCWPCPFNTTTDFEGASSPTECKRE